MIVNAQVAPAASAIKLPRPGSGAVTITLPELNDAPNSSSTAPAATIDITARSTFRERFAQYQRPEQKQVQRRGGLQEDGVG